MADMSIPASLIGGSILDLVTIGTYDNPLSIYREYIQNSADAAGIAENKKHGRVEIDIDPLGMCVRVRDDGPGLSAENACRALLPIARSWKQRGTDRGFRGIGRLSGLAFAETVTFLTRAESGEPVSRIVWDGPRLRESALQTQLTENAIRDTVVVEAIPGEEYPDHFFEVKIAGVGRHAAGLLLNREAVRAYIAEVCPVPFSGAFPFSGKIDKLLHGNGMPLILDVVLDGETTPVMRRHMDAIHFSDTRRDDFLEFEEIQIPSADGNGDAAVGWIAHSSYLGAIPKETGIRGIRVRYGNIQIGNETVFDHLFSEERFNRWCIGEVHILDSRIVPNGRWDYFEPSPHSRNLENRLAAVLHRIAVRCRKASSTRNSRRRVHAAIQGIEDTYDLAVSGYLASDDAKAMIEQALSNFVTIRSNLSLSDEQADPTFQKLRELEAKLRNFKVKRGRPPFSNMSKSEIKTYREVFHALTQEIESPRAAKKMIEAILSRD